VKKVLAVFAALWAAVPLVMLGSASGSSGGADRQVRYVRTMATSGFYVDNDPSGNSGGDLFGSTGDLLHAGQKIGSLSSACTASDQQHAQCNVTLILDSGGRLQLAGDIVTTDSENHVSIVGGTGKYKTARGDATLTRASQDGSVQRVRLRIIVG
jgi:hypothetical protein